MKRQLLCAAAVAALVCSACAPASAGAPQEAAPILVQAEAAVAASPLSVTVGEQAFRVPPYESSSDIAALQVTDAAALPKLPEGVSADIVVTRTVLDADGIEQEKTVFSGDETALTAFEPHHNGRYTYTVTPGGEDAEYRFTVTVNVAPRIRFSASGAALGETMAIYLDYADGLDASVTTTLSYKPKFYDVADGKMAMLPVSYYTAPGTYTVTVNVDGESHPYQVTATKRDFVVQNLTVDESTAGSTINNDAANREWNELIEPLKYVTDPQKYWDGPFLLPVTGRVTTQFGTIRYTNGSKEASRHGALDIAASTGTPVPAANAGRVIFAQYIQMSGNVVVIEHGLGLKTWYFHMSEINTKVDAMVKKGDIIGKVGATGFVTGPHLHFGMSVNNVYINPMTAIEKGVG